MSQEEIDSEEALVENLSKSLNEPSWLKQSRLEALEQFRILPEEQSTLYTKHGLNIGLALKSLESQATQAPDRLSIGEIASGIESGLYYVSTDNETIASKNIKNLESKGIIFCDLHEALEKHEKLLKQIFSKKAIKPSDDKYAAINSALFASGWLLYN